MGKGGLKTQKPPAEVAWTVQRRMEQVGETVPAAAAAKAEQQNNR